MQIELQAQKDYLKKNPITNKSFIDIRNYYESERRASYRDTTEALYELIDNSIEARATKIAIVSKLKKGDNKPEAMAVLDNGEGMPEGFLIKACQIAGTHRASHNSPHLRKGYGRFGHGLPKASISQTRSFTVYTKQDGTEWRELTVDIDELISSGSTDLPDEKITKKLPDWINAHLSKHFPNFKSGTIVSWNKVDRMTWKTEDGLKDNLNWKLSISYWRDIKTGTKINSLGGEIEPIDPLFLDSACAYVDECRGNTLKAEERPKIPWEVSIESGEKKEKVSIEVRASLFPKYFGSRDMKNAANSRSNRTVRQKILAAHNGIMFYREGRYITTLKNLPEEFGEGTYHRFQPYDMNYKIEINFPAKVDEDFGVITNKQSIRMSETLLKRESYRNIIKECKALYKIVENRRKDDESKNQEGPNSATEAFDESQKFIHQDSLAEKKKKDLIEAKAKSNLEKEIEKALEKEEDKTKAVQEKVIAKVTSLYTPNETHLAFEDIGPNNPPFRVVPIGGVRKLILNKGHNFISQGWFNSRCTDYTKNMIQSLFLALGEISLTAQGDAKNYYLESTNDWSRILNRSMSILWDKKGYEEGEDSE